MLSINSSLITTTKAELASLSLGKKQELFSIMIAQLILWAYGRGYSIRLGDAYRDPRLHGAIGVRLGYGHAKSAHKNKLALDLNLFKNGVYLDTTEAHTELGLEWERRGGTWGGRFNDGNHYSFEHLGIK